MKVAVIGAGIGGLVLGHALRGQGLQVSLHDKDIRAEDTGGYRLHLDPTACAVLARRLSPQLYGELMAASGPPTMRQFTFLDHRMRRLLRVAVDEPDDTMMIDRITLRTALSCSFGDVQFGHTFSRADVAPGGTIIAQFTDGTTVDADLLVGADGAHSTVVEQLTGAPIARCLRASGLAGTARLTPQLRSTLPAELDDGPAFAIGPGGTLLFLSARPSTHHSGPDTVLWGITTNVDPPRHNLPNTARDLLSSWSPPALSLINHTPPETITAFPYFAADPNQPMCPWPVGPITALGDAVHAMPPTGGRGAITAIQDADQLARHILDAHTGVTTLQTAIDTYQRNMPTYAVPALRESLQPLIWQRRLSNPLLYRLARLTLPIIDAVTNVDAKRRRRRQPSLSTLR